MPVEVAVDGFSNLAVGRATTLVHKDLEASNTKESPNTVTPAVLSGVSTSAGKIHLLLPPASWSAVRLAIS